MNKGLRLVIVLVGALTVACCCLTISFMRESKKIGFVDAIKLFNEYDMKKQLEKNSEQQLLAIKANADSLRTLRELMGKNAEVNKEALSKVEMELEYMNVLFDQEYAKSNRDINEKVWKRLNPIIDEFSRSKDLDLLVGANGMGTVLYGSKNTDYTEEIIKYVNTKYAEGI